jgi:hypothetical protein
MRNSKSPQAHFEPFVTIVAFQYMVLKQDTRNHLVCSAPSSSRSLSIAEHTFRTDEECCCLEVTETEGRLTLARPLPWICSRRHQHWSRSNVRLQARLAIPLYPSRRQRNGPQSFQLAKKKKRLPDSLPNLAADTVILSLGPATDLVLDKTTLGDELIPYLRWLIKNTRNTRWPAVLTSWGLSKDQADGLTDALLSDLVPSVADVQRGSKMVCRIPE